MPWFCQLTLVPLEDSKTSSTYPTQSHHHICSLENSAKLPDGSLIHIHHPHAKILHSPMQYFQVEPYFLICHFQSQSDLDTFHSYRNSAILGRCIIPPREHFTPLAQPHLSNIWGTSFVMPFSCMFAISKETPRYKNNLALVLCQIDKLPYIKTYPEDHVSIIWLSALGIPMPLGHFWTPNYLTNFEVPNWAQTHRQTIYIYSNLPWILGIFRRCARPWSFHRAHGVP